MGCNTFLLEEKGSKCSCSIFFHWISVRLLLKYFHLLVCSSMLWEFQWKCVIKYLQSDESSSDFRRALKHGSVPQSNHEHSCLTDFRHFYLNARQLARIDATYVCFIFSTNIFIRIEIVKQISNMLKHGFVPHFLSLRRCKWEMSVRRATEKKTSKATECVGENTKGIH